MVTQVHSWGSLEKISTYISPVTNICTCTIVRFVILFVFLWVQAEKSHVKVSKNMNKIPSKHVAPCNNSTGYSLPTRARIATGDEYPGGGDGPNPQRHSL